MSASYVFEAVDLGTMRPVRDISPIITADVDAFVEQDIDSDIWTTGQCGFAGARQWLSQLIRVSRVEDGTKEILGTFFPSLTDVELLTRELATGTIRLDGTLVALKSTLLPTSYVIASGASAVEVIRDMCRLAGVHSDISASEGNYRFPEAIFYDAGESALSLASEAASLAHVRLVSDRLGYVTTRSVTSQRGGEIFISGSSRTDLLSAVTKSYAFLTSPTRLIASYTSGDRSMFTSVGAEDSPQDAETRGRNFDTSLSVSTLPVDDLATLRAVAMEAFAEQQRETWGFVAEHRDIDAGDIATVRDYDSGEVLEGQIQSVRTLLTGLSEQEIVVKGDLI